MTKGQRIRLARESIELSQTDLAKKVGISKQTLYKYENDIVTNIPSDIVEELAHCCGCSPGYIMGWEKEKERVRNTRQVIADLYNSYDHDLLNRKQEGAGPRHRQELEEDKPTVSEFKEALELYRKYKEAIPQVQDAVDALLKVPKSDP